MLILNVIFTVAGIILLIFAALPHGKGVIPLHPIYGRLAGLLFVIASTTKYYHFTFVRGINDMWMFAGIAALGMFFLFLGLVAFRIKR